MRLYPIVLVGALVLAAAPAAAAPWSPPIDVSQSCCGAFLPTVAQDGAGVHHVWWAQAEPGEKSPWRLTYAQDAGGSFSTPVVLAPAVDARAIEVVHSGAAIHVLFAAYRLAYGAGCEADVQDGCSDVYFVESLDGGGSWTPALAIPHAADAVQRHGPALARDADGGLVVAYERDNSIVAVSRPADGTWTAEEQVTAIDAGQQHSPRLAITEAPTRVIHLLYRAMPMRGEGDRLMYSRREGAVWTAPVSISPIVGGALLSDIVTDGVGRLQVVFQSSAGGEYSIYFTESTDGGANWSAPSQLSAGYAARPAAARELGGETVHAVWDTGAAVVHAESTADGFTGPEVLSLGLDKSLEPHVSAGADISAVWHARPGGDAPYNIYFSTRAANDPPPADSTGGADTDASTTDASTTDASTTDEPTGAPSTSSGPDDAVTTADAATADTSSSGESVGPTSGLTGAATDGLGPHTSSGCECSTGGVSGGLLGALMTLVRRRRRTSGRARERDGV